MNESTIKEKMEELEKMIDYHFNDIIWLSKAMRSVKISKTKSTAEYSNEGLATVGDAVLKLVLADHLFQNGKTISSEITTIKEKLENNDTMRELIRTEHIIDYTYNDKHFFSDENIPKHEKVIDNDHPACLEALVASVYYDSDFYKTKEWIIRWLLPLLEKHKNIQEKNR